MQKPAMHYHPIALHDTTALHPVNSIHAVNWVHQIFGLPSVTESPFVRATLAGLQRKLAKPKTKKEPMTQEMLARMVDSLSHDPSLSDISLVASALLAFAAFLRYDELAKAEMLRRNH